MRRPKQVRQLLVVAGAAWVVWLLLAVASETDPMSTNPPGPGTLVFLSSMAQLAFWGGLLLAAGALQLLVRGWDRDWTSQQTFPEQVARSHYE